MICAIDTSNIFFITYSMFIKTLKKNNGPDYEVQEIGRASCRERV